MSRRPDLPYVIARKEGNVTVCERLTERKNGRLLYRCKCVTCGRAFQAVPKEIRGGRWICPCQRGRRATVIEPKGNRLRPMQLAYLAGLVDGEGYVGIVKATRKDRGGRFGYQAIVTIGMTERTYLRYIQQMTGLGKIYRRKQRGARAKTSYQLDWRSNSLRELLPQLSPYLRLKRNNAKFVLQYLSMAGQVNHKDPVALEAYHQQCAQLVAAIQTHTGRCEARQAPGYRIHTTPEIGKSLQLAYIAALIDGEGQLALTKSHRKHRGGRAAYAAYAEIANTSLPLLKLVRKWLGAGTIQAKRKRQRHHSQTYVLHLSARPLRDVLPSIRRHLVLKQRQADLLLGHLKAAGRFNRRNPLAVARYMAGREKVYQQLKRLNQRGR